MQNSRGIKRHKKHYRIRFGIYSPMCPAVTEDISVRGLFIKTTSIAPVGTRLLMELTMPNNEIASFEGIVRWAKSCSPQIDNLLLKGGMGVEIIRFIAGETTYRQHITELNSRVSTYGANKTRPFIAT